MTFDLFHCNLHHLKNFLELLNIKNFDDNIEKFQIFTFQLENYADSKISIDDVEKSIPTNESIFLEVELWTEYLKIEKENHKKLLFDPLIRKRIDQYFGPLEFDDDDPCSGLFKMMYMIECMQGFLFCKKIDNKIADCWLEAYRNLIKESANTFGYDNRDNI